jgi:hypothetical protein
VISARAFAIYLYLLNFEPTISARAISKNFKEGRDAIAEALRELRRIGLLETKKVKIQGRIMTVSKVVEADYWPPETRLLLQQSPLYSLLSTNSLYSYKQERVAGEARDQYED